MVYGTIVEVFLQKLSQWYCDASPEAPSPEYTGSGDYRSSAPGGSAQGPSSHLTVADHRRPDAVSCPKRVVFRYGVRFSLGSCPKGVVFQARYRLHYALPSPSVQSEEGYMQRCRRVQLNFVALQSEIVAL